MPVLKQTPVVASILAPLQTITLAILLYLGAVGVITVSQAPMGGYRAGSACNRVTRSSVRMMLIGKEV